jgi:Tfp pilus assembly major pilin PilA
MKMLCQKCGVESSDEARYCSNCGSDVAKQESAYQEPCAVNAPGPGAANPLDYYEAAVGYRNTEYYVSRFKRFDEQGVKASWNWPSFFVSFYWLLYRKMWGWAALYFVLPLILIFVFVLLSGVWEYALLLYYPTYIAAIFVLFPMYANAIYYKHSKGKISKAQASSDNKEKQLRRVAAEGGTGGAVIIVVLILGIVSLVGILAAIAIPAYHDYTLRAYVSEGLVGAQVYKAEVEEYASTYGHFPSSTNALGGKEPAASAAVGSVNIVANGVIVITYAGSAGIAGKSVALVPSVNELGVISWQCQGVDIDNKYLPAVCRN